MNNPLVSILVPIYGVEKYIKRCAISLFEQTYKNIEFVFVNDCTRDSSISVLKGVVTEYPHLADKVKIINHIRNKGLAAARNTAVKESSGDFIFHVDADDWLEKTAIESCVNVQEVNDADVVTVNAKAIWNNRVELYNTPSTTNPKDLLRAILSRRAICNIWGRLIRKSLYVKNNIFNVEGLNISEDLQIMPQLLFFSSKIAVCTKPLYNYECRNQSSYTSTYNIKSDLQNQETAVILRDFMQKNDSALLKYIDVLDITNVVLSIKGCMKDDRNLDFFRSNVLGRRENLNSSLFKDIPLVDRLTLYIKNEWLLKEYVRLASFIKIKILKR